MKIHNSGSVYLFFLIFSPHCVLQQCRQFVWTIYFTISVGIVVLHTYKRNEIYKIYVSKKIVHTWRCYHFLPLLKQCCFQTVSWAERISFMSRHELLHWFQDYTQLKSKQTNHITVIYVSRYVKKQHDNAKIGTYCYHRFH